jgi:hypothetical protein
MIERCAGNARSEKLRGRLSRCSCRDCAPFFTCLKIELLAKRIHSYVNRRQSAQRSIRINLRKLRPFGRHFVFRENCLNRTFGHTRVTIDARLGINYQHVIIEMKGFYWTRNSAIRIATVDAGLGNYIGHPKEPPRVMQLLRA